MLSGITGRERLYFTALPNGRRLLKKPQALCLRPLLYEADGKIKHNQCIQKKCKYKTQKNVDKHYSM